MPLWGTLLIASIGLGATCLVWRRPAAEEAARRPSDDARVLVQIGGIFAVVCAVGSVIALIHEVLT
jgi:hypothetical protein